MKISHVWIAELMNKIFLMFFVCSLLSCGVLHAANTSLALPDDPRQSITYWKPHAVDANKDLLVAKSQAVFSTLLRSWDYSRLEPGLFVVNSADGAWAASLADGNILLSYDAIKTCMSFGNKRGEHLLAFVLAHELAHQKADDLWHQRFFRMIGNQAPDAKLKMLHGLNLDKQKLAEIEAKEAQADHDGLILMSSVGYDPYQILDKKDFFTAWVESIWSQSCKQNKTAMRDACEQAQARALRTQAQLSSVASQAMLYELGVQSFVAGKYIQARKYFTAYGREYTSRSVVSALGLTFLAQALEDHNELLKQGGLNQPVFYYPLMLDAKANRRLIGKEIDNQQKRSDKAHYIKQLKQSKKRAVKQSIHYFEKAIRLEPDHKKTYLLLASAHILDANTYMARGVLQGRYVPQFKRDISVDALLAMTRALEGDKKQAAKEFSQLIKSLATRKNDSAIQENLLVYSAYFNSAAYATYTGDTAKEKKLWQQLAKKSKKSGQSLLFRLALSHIVKTGLNTVAPLTTAPNVKGLRLGDQLSDHKSMTKSSSISELWIEGEKHEIHRNLDGSRFIISTKGKIISAWQNAGAANISALSIGDSADRPFKTLGLPDRRLNMLSGEYLAYDQYGLALHINNNKISGWFLY
jgi:hypothetical protein